MGGSPWNASKEGCLSTTYVLSPFDLHTLVVFMRAQAGTPSVQLPRPRARWVGLCAEARPSGQRIFQGKDVL